ncbi:SAP30-binding protein, partial [Coemansia biformis]
GGSGSDDSAAVSGNDSPRESAESPLLRPRDAGDSDAGRPSPISGRNGDGANGQARNLNDGLGEYGGMDGKDVAAYMMLRRDLYTLLGCDAVPDFAPVDAEAGCPELQAKFQQWYQLKEQGANFNEALMRNKTFRNPNIYRWLVDHLQLEEAGSNLPSDRGFDPAKLREDFTPAGLAEEQERRARESAARKAARAAAARAASTGSCPPQQLQFRSVGFEGPQLLGSAGLAGPAAAAARPAPPGRWDGDSGTAQSGSSGTAQSSGGRSFEEAVQRAKQIAQHLVQSKRR